MSSFARKIKKQQEEKAKGQVGLTEAQKRLPAGRLTTSPIRGTYTSIPLLSWVAKREEEGVPLVMMGLALLDQKNTMVGNLQIEFPVYKGETDADLVGHLKKYGWKGGVWSDGDPGWPTGDPSNEDLLSTLIHDTHTLKATMVFPPNDEGQNAVMPVTVGRAKGSFLMPPLPKADEPDEELIQRLHDLCDNYHMFYQDSVLPEEMRST